MCKEEIRNDVFKKKVIVENVWDKTDLISHYLKEKYGTETTTNVFTKAMIFVSDNWKNKKVLEKFIQFIFILLWKILLKFKKIVDNFYTCYEFCTIYKLIKLIYANFLIKILNWLGIEKGIIF